MRIITGKRRGLKLFTPKDNSIRPTEDRIKESIFNIIGNVTDSIVLDLYSGTGSIGLEFLSRGSKEVYLVDKSSRSIEIIKKNVEKISLDGVFIYHIDSAKALDKFKNIKFDYIYLDPPYDNISEYMNSLSTLYNNKNTDDTLIIVESRDELDIKEIDLFNIIDKRDYKSKIVYFLRGKN